jgi:hypothetical protein
MQRPESDGRTWSAGIVQCWSVSCLSAGTAAGQLRFMQQRHGEPAGVVYGRRERPLVGRPVLAPSLQFSYTRRLYTTAGAIGLRPLCASQAPSDSRRVRELRRTS